MAEADDLDAVKQHFSPRWLHHSFHAIRKRFLAFSALCQATFRLHVNKSMQRIAKQRIACEKTLSRKRTSWTRMMPVQN
jgi:hypothetical protein